MRFGFTEDQLLFQATVRDLLQKECTPQLVRESWSSPTGRPPELWRALAEMGVVGLTVDEARGGLGLDERDLVLLLEEIGRAAAPAPLLETTAVAVPLLRDTSPELADRWLPRVAAGNAILTVGLVHAELVADAHVADLLLLQHGDALHAVEPSGVELEHQRSVDGARRLSRVRWSPSASTLVVQGERAGTALDAAFERGAVAAAAQLLGLAQHLLDVSVGYAKVREQFGVPIGSFQAVKHHLANAALALEFARPLVYRAASSIALADPDAPQHASMAKASASDAASAVARTALQVHGAIGYAFEYDLHLWMKRVWALAASWGDAATHRRRVQGALLGR